MRAYVCLGVSVCFVHVMRERESAYVLMCVYVCVCEREQAREGSRDRGRESNSACKRETGREVKREKERKKEQVLQTVKHCFVKHRIRQRNWGEPETQKYM